jgi:hypothetical protein
MCVSSFRSALVSCFLRSLFTLNLILLASCLLLLCVWVWVWMCLCVLWMCMVGFLRSSEEERGRISEHARLDLWYPRQSWCMFLSLSLSGPIIFFSSCDLLLCCVAVCLSSSVVNWSPSIGGVCVDCVGRWHLPADHALYRRVPECSAQVYGDDDLLRSVCVCVCVCVCVSSPPHGFLFFFLSSYV